MMSNDVRIPQEDIDAYLNSGVKYRFIDRLGAVFKFDTAWPSYLWGRFRAAFGSPFQLCSFESRLRRPGRPLPDADSSRGHVGDYDIPDSHLLVLMWATGFIFMFYQYVRYLWLHE